MALGILDVDVDVGEDDDVGGDGVAGREDAGDMEGEWAAEFDDEEAAALNFADWVSSDS